MEKQKITKQKKPFYKKWWVWVIAIFLLISVFASGNDNTQQQTVANNQEQVQAVDAIVTPTITPAAEIASTITPAVEQSTPIITKSTNTSNENTTVYYVKGSSVYHLSKDDSTLRKSKNILSMTLKEALGNGMHQSRSKADN